jgi:lysozyme family protein
LLPFGGLFAYMLGYLPALATGFAVAATDCVADLGQFRTPFAIVIGAAITVSLLYGVSGMENQAEPVGYAGAGAVAAAVVAIAGGVCAMIAPRRVPSWPSA